MSVNTNTLDYILKKFNLDIEGPLPIEIPNVGRNDLPIWLHELDFKVGVEVGVAAGEYSEVIAKTNPQMKIYGVDIWKGYKEYKHYVKDEEFEKLFEKTQRRLSGYPNYKIIRELSMNALRFFDDNSLDFVYLDANHEDPFISEDIREWYKKLKNGGILAGHDYIRPGDSRRNKFDAQEKWDVIDAVNRYTKENNIRPWFILGSQGKIPGTVRDNSRSWMWVKSTAVLEDTGERQIPSIPGTLEGVDINHTQRYGWAAMFTTGKFVYDISCGTGYGSLLLGAKQYAGFDLSSETIEYAKNYYGKSQSVSFSVADACKMPENLELADVIISFETIEHIKEPETFLKWCADHGKILVLSSPIRGSFGRSRFHLTEYNLSELTNMLNKYFNNVRLFVQKDQKISFPCLPEDKGVVIAICQHIKK